MAGSVSKSLKWLFTQNNTTRVTCNSETDRICRQSFHLTFVSLLLNVPFYPLFLLSFWCPPPAPPKKRGGGRNQKRQISLPISSPPPIPLFFSFFFFLVAAVSCLCSPLHAVNPKQDEIFLRCYNYMHYKQKPAKDKGHFQQGVH